MEAAFGEDVDQHRQGDRVFEERVFGVDAGDARAVGPGLNTYKSLRICHRSRLRLFGKSDPPTHHIGC
jgi:hypothetical protein